MTVTLPSLVTITHRPWTLLDPPQADGQGNPKGQYGDPVDRQVIAVRWLETSEIVSAEYQGRTVTDIAIWTHDPSPYSDKDEVIVNGVAYQVRGLPLDHRSGIFPLYDGLLGGEVKARRVT